MNIFGDLHFVDSAPVLGVLGLGVARVDDLLVVVEKLLADRTLGVQVLGEVLFWSKSSFFRSHLVGGLGKAVLLQLTLDLRKKTSTKDQGEKCLRFYKFFHVFIKPIFVCA